MRMLDTRICKFISVDPITKDYPELTPYQFASNTPIQAKDLDGLEADYETGPTLTPKLILGSDEINKMTSITNGHPGYTSNIARKTQLIKEAAIEESQFNIRTSNTGTINNAVPIVSFELWLDKPSDNFGEGLLKIGANVAYSEINSPVSLFTGKTIGVSPINSAEKTDAFVDFIPQLLSFGLSKTGAVLKTLKGLPGFNDFVKRSPDVSKFKVDGSWQKNASKLFKSNATTTKGLEDFSKARTVTGTANEIKKEVNK